MAIVLKNVSKSLGLPPTEILKSISLNINDGEFVALTGKSGSGKSTLLYILSTLDFATMGEVLIDSNDFSVLPSADVHQFRNKNIGFVFQFHHLIGELTALENVLMPARKNNEHIKLENRAKELLVRFGLEHKFNRFPRELSGGEQQRVAIARALIMSPKYVFADEPTGNLDSINAEVVMKHFLEINEKENTTIVFVTHDDDFASLAKRKIYLADGRVIY